MELTILGSGGAMPTPRPFCQCAVCQKARVIGEPYRRNSCSLFVDDINTVIDCGEDIADSLNRRDIKRVDNLFITHWHPDHTFGFRPLLEANYDFRAHCAKHTINVYIPNKVYECLIQKLPSIEYLLNYQNTGKLHLLEDSDVVDFGDMTVTAVGYKGAQSDIYAYYLENCRKKVLYAACDTISFERYNEFADLDLLLNECGLFEDVGSEITIENLMNKVREIRPKKTLLTHIEEIELNVWGEGYLDVIRQRYADINFGFAIDGLKITV